MICLTSAVFPLVSHGKQSLLAGYLPAGRSTIRPGVRRCFILFVRDRCCRRTTAIPLLPLAMYLMSRKSCLEVLDCAHD